MGTISKPNTFSAGATIIAAEHNDNFDTIYNEFNGSISNANIASNAAIVDTKLAQITTANKVAVSAIEDGSIDFDEVTCNAVIIDEDTVPTTAANQGALYCKNDGTQTEIYFVEESAGDEVQMTKGGVLNALLTISDYGTSASVSSNIANTAVKIAAGTTSVNGSGGSQAVTNLPFTSNTSYHVTICPNSSTQLNSPPQSLKNSGAQFTLYNFDTNVGGASSLSWIAIGS